MKQSEQQSMQKTKAVDDLISNISALGTAVTDKVKESAMDAIHETIETAKDKTREVLHNYDPKAVIQAYPKSAVAAAFAIGAFVGLRRFALLKPAALTLISLGGEWLIKTHGSSLFEPRVSLDKTLH